jgi:hypothetical protein
LHNRAVGGVETATAAAGTVTAITDNIGEPVSVIVVIAWQGEFIGATVFE